MKEIGETFLKDINRSSAPSAGALQYVSRKMSVFHPHPHQMPCNVCCGKVSVLCPHLHLVSCSVCREKCLSFTLTPCYDLIFGLRAAPGLFPISVVSLISSIPPLPPLPNLSPLPPYLLTSLPPHLLTSLRPLPPYLLISFTSLPSIPRIPPTFPSEAFN